MQKEKISNLFRSWFPFVFGAILTGLFLVLPWLGAKLGAAYVSKGAASYVQQVVEWVQQGLAWPLSSWVSLRGLCLLLLFPWFVGWGLLLRLVHVLIRPAYKYLAASLVLVFLLLRIFPGVLLWGESDASSRSVGSVGNGRLEEGKRIPFQGKNFQTYSFVGYLAGRTFVHEKVRKTVLETYEKCAEALPGRGFVLMETGSRAGGRFLPHKTHQSGLSVDFMTPQLKNGKPYENRHVFNLWGYRREFDDTGKVGDIQIDYETLAQHLLLLYETVGENGLKIEKVIFDPVLQPYLLQTPTGKRLKGKFYFTRGRVMVRHDDHYHVDFTLK